MQPIRIGMFFWLAALGGISFADVADRICPLSAATTSSESILEWHHENPPENVWFEIYAKNGPQDQDLTDTLKRLGVVPPSYAVRLFSVRGTADCEDFPPADIGSIVACGIRAPRGIAILFDLANPSRLMQIEVPLLEVVVGQNLELLPSALATLSISLIGNGIHTEKWLGRKAECYGEIPR